MKKMKAIAAAMILTAGSFGFMATAQNSLPAPGQSAPVKEKVCKQKAHCTEASELCRNATGKGKHRLKNEGRKERMDPFQGIELTSSQKAKLKKAREEKKSDMKKLKQKGAKERAKVNSDYDKDLKKILTHAQLAQYERNCKKMKEAGKMRHGHGKVCKDGKVRKDGKRGKKSGMKRAMKAETVSLRQH